MAFVSRDSPVSTRTFSGLFSPESSPTRFDFKDEIYSFFSEFFRLNHCFNQELRDGQSAMNRLTKQWFDEVNTDAMPTTRSNEDNNHRVYFKKSSSSTTTDERNKTVGPKTTKNKGVVYQNLNSSFKSNNVLLESTDEENEYNSDEEEIVIDKQQIKNNYK